MRIGWQSGITGRFAVGDSPRPGLSQALGNVAQQSKVVATGTCGELAEADGGVANVRAAGDTGAQKFTEKRAVPESTFGSELSMFSRTLPWSRMLVHGMDGINGKGCGVAAFNGRRSLPVMGAENTVNVGLGGKDDGIVTLVDINPLKSLRRPK